MKLITFIRDCSLGENIHKPPFMMSLSNHELPFDKLRANGGFANKQSRFITLPHSPQRHRDTEKCLKQGWVAFCQTHKIKLHFSLVFRYLCTSVSLLLSVFFILGIQPAVADVILPDVDAKYVSIKAVNPTRDAGYVVGDVLDRTITLTVKKPYELVKESLPIEGYEHRYKGQISGIELVRISTEETRHSNSVTHVLHLTYQVFTTGKLAKPAALRAEIVKLRNTNNQEVLQYRIPSYSFRISPLSVFGSVKLKEEMSPFIVPLLLDSSKDQLKLKVLIGLLALSLLGLLYMLGMRAWLPRMGAPFAKAYRDLRKMPDTATGLQQAVARVHVSLNQTAGASLFSNNLDDFLQNKPAFAPAKKEIEQFFGLSRRVFFEDVSASGTAADSGENAKTWLLKFCRHLRDCERGLHPDLKSTTRTEVSN